MDMQTLLPRLAAAASLPLIVHVADLAEDDGDAGHDGPHLAPLLRHMPGGYYRHMVVERHSCVQWELRRGGQLARLPGSAAAPRWSRVWSALRLYRRLRTLRPALVHTDSRAVQWLAALAGVPVRLHAARADTPRPARHGVAGLLARLLSPGLASGALNVVDCTEFHPRLGPAASMGPPGFLRDGALVIGMCGPMDGQHGHAQLVEGFITLRTLHGAQPPLRLLLAGDGPERAACMRMLEAAGAGHLAWLPGQPDDVARLMRLIDVYAAPACTELSAIHVLQAMASGLPVVACQGEAHEQLIQGGWTGALVPSGETMLLAEALADYVRIPGMARRHGARARRHALDHHSLSAVAARYVALYDSLLAPPRHA